jgi:glycosyltransferase involved in cell wall biosynthesis
MRRCREDLGVPLDAKVLFTFGILQKRKGLEYLIEAMDIIRRTRGDVQCYIGGRAEYEKSYETYLRKRVAELNLEDRVHFLGFMEGPDIPAWINSSDLFVLPSLEEGFGIAQIEALACGKPVVATRCGGPGGVIEKGDGILVPPNNRESLSEAMTVMVDQRLRFSDRTIRDNCVRRFGAASFAKSIGMVYSRVLAARNS